ncbi:C6 zinc finger domain containing protein [Pyrenophora tritici-repentis]|nr:hypothetical protein PtrV1_11560 [Pyrenophora tritici-repentis]KAF7444364.1 c6 zinc finger domain containing protein [Pyrenophora tritici-repentis]KAG9378607.1 c6 zinc finger domain containing protein [Pyrenophora tritici-repentis]KAI0578827.1 c6 zinc finger domain-containing protein [Pyrenophora tritici-repentis]KAI0608354.1 c6 zinc finger domain-containing protein [Pyrenophora tritici-repentis]
MASNPTTTAPVKRACDSCHRRKVKCIGEGTAPCKNCVSAGLACTYNAIPQKKGPKGSRAKVLSELRETQRNAQLAAGFPTDLGYDGRSLPSTFARTQGLLPPALVESCIEYFFNNVYPTEPVLHRQRAQEAAVGMDRSTEAYCMIVALCAYVMIQGNHKPHVNVLPRQEMAHMSNVGIGHVLLEESVRVRQGYDHRENPTHMSVLTSYFYHGCYFGLARENTAWTYLREATTQAQLLGMHDEETYKHDPLDVSRKRVLYWLLFIAERTYALHKRRPITLHPTIHTPSLDEVPSDRPIAVGLELMINMFKIIDDNFINLWNRVHNTHASAAWIAQVQTQLSEAVPAYFECTEAQEVQIRITQHWLRSQAWQLSVSQGLVSSVTNDPPLTFKYPIEISRDLLTTSHQFSQQAMEVHGVGLIEKLFDIACCLTDVVACTTFSPDQFALGPRDYVSRFLTLISTLRGGQSRYLPLLLSKLNEVLPNLPLPRSLNLPQTVSASTLGLNASGSGTLPSNVADDFSASPASSSPSYPSNDLIRRIAAHTGAQLPFNTTQQSMISAPTTHVGDLSLYDTSQQSTTHSSSSGPRSNSTTPGPYETPLSQSRSQIVGHSAMQLPTSHGHMQSHHMGVNATAYDPRFSIQNYPVDPMMYKH